MEYWAYENWRALGHKLVIHISICGHCNKGMGVRGGAASPNGKWHGPFKSIQDAKSAVLSVEAKFHNCAVGCRG